MFEVGTGRVKILVAELFASMAQKQTRNRETNLSARNECTKNPAPLLVSLN